MKWTSKAAEQGEVVAQANLGFLYEWGQGVPKDYVQAYKWFSLAAAAPGPAQSIAEARVQLSWMSDLKLITAAQIKEAERLVREWKPKPSQ